VRVVADAGTLWCSTANLGPSSPNRKSNARARANGPAGDSEFFLERGARANIKKAWKILRRAGKDPPRRATKFSSSLTMKW
jgi:hypothetical protein